MRNPKWTRDELILALDLYFRHPPTKINKEHKDVVVLSDLLNTLPIHPNRDGFEKFRNPNGVYMKLCNFLRFDPNYKGNGLKAGGKLEEDIWQEFSGDKAKLKKISQAIIDSAPDVPRPTGSSEIEEEFEEGRVLTKLHKIRERSPSLIRKKKKEILTKSGKLECEVCGFDFAKFYGDVGQGFIECHHIKPVAELKKGENTKLSELSILCANCHRVIHKSKPMLAVHELKNIVKTNNTVNANHCGRA